MKSIERAQAERLVEDYSDLILRLSYTYLKSTHDAQDICQNVLIKMLTTNQTFENQEHEKAWIIRATANECKDFLKSAWRRRTCDLEACAEMPAPEMQDGALAAAVNTLPASYREAIYLHYYEGYEVWEIAVLLDQKPATVSTHLNRGRRKLEKLLGGELYEGV